MTFKDRETRVVCAAGSYINVTDERAKELLARGFVEFEKNEMQPEKEKFEIKQTSEKVEKPKRKKKDGK